ncbi:MAG: pseudouridine synthase [Bernardetiaceae bacterium]|nr:pseudouridine synthase [Bernardetiaceae bacterium]
MPSFSYYYLYKPYNMLSQFSPEGDNPTLADLEAGWAKDIYPVGRLDKDSEGLLILTNDNHLKNRLLLPDSEKQKTYLVQVEGEISDEALVNLRKGVHFRIKKKEYKSLPAQAERIATPALPERNPPVRFRKSVPTSWLKLSIHEGKNRQVRRMTAAVGFPTLRLVRYAVGNLTIEGLLPSEWREISQQEIYTQTGIFI